MSPSLLDVRFLGLLAALILARRLVPARYATPLGALGSALLIGLASLPSLIAIGGITLLGLYPLHLVMNSLRGRRPRARRAVLAVGVCGLVAFMVGFKVYQSFSLPFLGAGVLDHRLQQLIGFSYFLFRAINFLYIQYLVDVRLGSPVPLLYYTLFPPTFTSGPIHKFLDFNQQLETPVTPRSGDYINGVYRITRGYFRKLCLAYLLNKAVVSLLAGGDPDPLRSLGVIASIYLYFYFDFAGYSDIAIGFGRMMGIRVPENFKEPLKASTLTEFWRNWHITLVEFLRDHVFIPLGGMRSGRAYSSVLALLVMVLCGLWHGLTLPFVFWGLWHGSMLMIEAWVGTKPTPRNKRGTFNYWCKVGWTNLRVALGALLFLPDPANITFVLKGFLP